MKQPAPVRTPLGTYATAGQAAQAHLCSVATIQKRIRTDPVNYVRLAVEKKPRRPKLYEAPERVTNTTWPISWARYKLQVFETREEIFLNWCHKNQRDPESETTVNCFFEEMDTVFDEEQDEEQVV
jgi:hypothetical protein